MLAQEILSRFMSHGVLQVKLNEPLANHTTWRIGGPADVFVVPETIEEVCGALRAANALGMPWTVIGRGSNLLVQDNGVRGLVLKMHDQFADVLVDGCSLIAEAGRSYVSAAGFAVKHGLSGMEFATGIPGTVGGAVMMNAGAHGGQTSDVLEWAEVADPSGHIERLTNSELTFAYRYSILKDSPGIVVRAKFNLQPGDASELTAKIKEWAKRRSKTQPLSLPSCGSVFRNPTGTFAAKLIEEAGLKGFMKGGAQISEKHANFIVNRDHATARDVLWLIDHVQNTIREKCGIQLETEVRVIGEPASER